MAVLQDTGRLAILSNKRVFIGLITNERGIAWTEISFKVPIVGLHQDRSILYVQSEESVFQVDFREYTPIEEDVEVSLTLPAPLAYLIKSNAPTMDRLDQYEVNKGHLIGEITKNAFVGSSESVNQYTSNRKDSVQFSQVRLKDLNDAPKVTFRGRQVRVSSAIFEIGGV